MEIHGLSIKVIFDILYEDKKRLTGRNKFLYGTFSYFVLANDNGKKLINLCESENGCEILQPNCGRIVSFAAGDVNYRQSFCIAVVEYDETKENPMKNREDLAF